MSKETFAMRLTVLLLCLLVVGRAMAGGTGSKEGIRISVDELREMLGSSDLIILDVRDPLNWSQSDVKILGAEREDPREVDSWAAKYSKDKTLVFY